jgi:hypothetical protein
MSESLIGKQIQVSLAKRGARLFRNNNCVAYAGEVTHLPNGDVYIKNARMIRSGLGVGTSDYVGFTPMDGKAIFTAVEVKTLHGRATKEQPNFIAAVKAAGGIAFIAHSEAEANKLLTDAIGKL